MLYLQFCAQVYLSLVTNNAGEWLKSFIFHYGINSITANGQTVVYVGADYMCHIMIIYLVQKCFGNHQVILNNVLCCIYVIHGFYKEITL